MQSSSAGAFQGSRKSKTQAGAASYNGSSDGEDVKSMLDSLTNVIKNIDRRTHRMEDTQQQMMEDLKGVKAAISANSAAIRANKTSIAANRESTQINKRELGNVISIVSEVVSDVEKIQIDRVKNN